MAERTFEMDLDRLFGESPAFADAEGFAHRVEASLERGWTFRRMLIGGLGLAGGLFGAVQLVGTDGPARIDALIGQYAPNIQIKWTDVAVSHLMPGGGEINGEMLWMSAALLVLAVGFALTRAIRDI